MIQLLMVASMRETDLVMDLMRELSRRDCNGHATVRLGTALADPARFRSIFTHYARGTYFEQVDLEIEEEQPVVACPCGYREEAPRADALERCPYCAGATYLLNGNEFEVLEPDA